MKICKKMSVLFLCVIFIISILSITTTAATSFAGGDGTKENPYQVSTPEQLNEVRNNLDKCFIQINDIDMTAATDVGGIYYNNGSGFIPIGLYPSSFSGTYDGGGHSIIGLKMNSSSEFVGLFSTTRGVIKNLVLNSDVKGDYIYLSYLGGIAAINGGIIENCYITGNVTGYVSEEIGYEYAHLYTGGIVGANSGTIISCYITGNVTAAPDKYFAEYIYSFTGGIAGKNYGDIINCYNTANVSSHFGSRDENVGGIAGSSESNIINCYNAGSVHFDAGCGGGIAGYGYYGIIENCYWNKDLDLFIEGICEYYGTSLVISGKTTTEMKSQEFADLLNQNRGDYAEWAINPSINNGYPYLLLYSRIAELEKENDEDTITISGTAVEINGTIEEVGVKLDNTRFPALTDMDGTLLRAGKFAIKFINFQSSELSQGEHTFQPYMLIGNEEVFQGDEIVVTKK